MYIISFSTKIILIGFWLLMVDFLFRYLKEVAQNREDNYNREEERHYENSFRKEYESKRSNPSDKDEFTNDSYHRDFDRERETNFSGKGLVFVFSNRLMFESGQGRGRIPG